MACSMRAWLTLVMLIFAAINPAAAEPRRVLLLHSFGPQFVPWVFFAGQFREELFKQSPEKIDLYEASLEGSRFQQPDERAVFPIHPTYHWCAGATSNQLRDAHFE